MKKYRKLPVIIEAQQWLKNGDHPEDDCQVYIDFDGGKVKGEGKVVRYFRDPDIVGTTICTHCDNTMHYHGWIDTIQGGHVVCPADWIIKDLRVAKGKHGHHYPCKPDIFGKTYEEVLSCSICDYVILADTEDWDKPLCLDCWKKAGSPTSEPNVREEQGNHETK